MVRLRVFLVVLITVGAAHASTFQVRLIDLHHPAIDSESPNFIAVSLVDAAPDGQLIIVPWSPDEPRLVSLRDVKADPVRLSSLGVLIEPPVQVLGRGPKDLLIGSMRSGLRIIGPDWKVTRTIPRSRFNPYAAVAASTTTVVGLGTASEGPGTSGSREPIRVDCLLFALDLRETNATPRALVCNDRFASPAFRSVFPLGDFVSSRDGRRMYAVFEGLSQLWILSASGDVVTAVSLGIEFGEISDGQRTRALRERGFFYEFRSNFRWIQGLLRGPEGSVGVVFREFRDGNSIFTLDLFDPDGNRVVSAKPLGLSRPGNRAHARMVVFDDAQYLLVNEPNADFTSVGWQKLYRIEMDRHSSGRRKRK